MIFFATYGVIILGIFIGIVGHEISQAQEKAVNQLRKGRQLQVIQTLFAGEDASDQPEGFLKDHVTLLDDIRQVVNAELPSVLLVAFAAYILGLREHWSLTSTMYFCVMSATTTGFGDYTPKTQIDKVYCIFFLPVAVCVFGEVLGRIASIYIRQKQRKAERKFLHRSLTLCDLRRMDTNSDGMVDMEEFLTFMLVTIGKVDKETIDELRSIYHSLDTNGNGTLEQDDLVAVTTRNRIPALQELQ